MAEVHQVGEFDGRIALVTGGTGALGGTLCRLLAEAGARLFLTYRSPEHLEETLSQLPPGSEVRHAQADVTREEDVSRAVSAALQEYGQVDILCNLAGGYLPGSPLWETLPAAWDSLLDLNARSAYLMMRRALPHMIERGLGWVVNVSAKVAASRPPRTAAYAAAKDAVAVVTEIVAKEVRDYNIWVNAVAPSVIDTEANRISQPTADFSRWVSRRQVAEVILFLCSQRASGVRGAVVPVYGRLL
jgi:NAD(P)-dependent dehydrogenase (short-subunit alcohol dehydrogenase family)